VSDALAIKEVLQALPVEQRTAIRESARRGLEALRKPEDLSLAVWAHRYFHLSAESSQREEKWEAWPFQIGILDCMGNDAIEEFTFFKSARLGYTKCLLADIGYTAQHQRRNQAVWLPKDGDSDDFVKTDLDPMLEDVSIMRTVFPKALAKSKVNSLQQKKFSGSICKLRGGHAAGNYRRLTVAKGRADELDGFEQSVEGAGTPDSLIRKRVEGATYPKCIWGSTGRKKHLSHIERLHGAMDIRMRFFITCPHCDVEHPLEWGGEKVPYGFKWDKLDPFGTVHHKCQHCHGSTTQADYLRLARTGRWVSECGNYCLAHGWDAKGEPFARWTRGDGVTPCLPPKRVGMHCWTAYSPQVSWAKILEEFLDAARALKHGNREPMIQWVNETKGETYEETGEKADVSELHTRAKASGFVMRTVPMGGLVLIASVDVQDDRFEIMVMAVGRGDVPEVWVIDYIVMDANPAVMADWDRLWDRLQQQYQHRHGAWISIAGAAVDTGGHFTHQAYFFVAKYRDRNPNFRLFAIKGSSKDGDPIKARSAKWLDVNAFGRVIKRGVKLWMVGTDTAKDLFYNRLKVPDPGPGYVHFASNLSEEFFKQYGNEKRIKVRSQGGTIERWVHFQGRNEAVDLTAYCLFVIEALEIPKWTEPKWRRLEDQVAPDLFSVEDEPAAAAAPRLPAPPPGQAIEPAGAPQEPKTRQRPPEAARTRQASAQPAHSPFASEEWLRRG
jgi:terminase, large subunit